MVEVAASSLPPCSTPVPAAARSCCAVSATSVRRETPRVPLRCATRPAKQFRSAGQLAFDSRHRSCSECGASVFDLRPGAPLQRPYVWNQEDQRCHCGVISATSRTLLSMRGRFRHGHPQRALIDIPATPVTAAYQYASAPSSGSPGVGRVVVPLRKYLPDPGALLLRTPCCHQFHARVRSPYMSGQILQRLQELRSRRGRTDTPRPGDDARSCDPDRRRLPPLMPPLRPSEGTTHDRGQQPRLVRRTLCSSQFEH